MVLTAFFAARGVAAGFLIAPVVAWRGSIPVLGRLFNATLFVAILFFKALFLAFGKAFSGQTSDRATAGVSAATCALGASAGT